MKAKKKPTPAVRVDAFPTKKHRVLADLRHFDPILDEVGPLPTVQAFDRLEGEIRELRKREKQIEKKGALSERDELKAVEKQLSEKACQRRVMMLAVRIHTLIQTVVDEQLESEDHNYDVRKVELINALLREIRILPKAVHGERFPSGRDEGAVGALHRAMVPFVKKYPGKTGPELLKLFAAKPPRGWRVDLDRKIIEGPKRSWTCKTFINKIPQLQKD